MKYKIKKIFFFSNHISFLSTLLFFLFFIGSKENLISNQNQEIQMIISGSGTQRILGDKFPYNNFEVLINGEKNEGCKKICDLTKESNNITIIFNETIESCYAMFSEAKNIIELDLSNFDISFVTDMTGIFHNCSLLKSINLANINTSNVKLMNYSFFGCRSLESIDLSNFDTSNDIDMKNMFKKCDKLKFINLSHLNMSLVEDISSMFYGCFNLESVHFPDLAPLNLKDFNQLFYKCINLNSIISNFDTSNIKNFSRIFYGCHSLKNLDLSNFNTSNAIDMHEMFAYCLNLESLDISKFDTSLVTNLTAMFCECKSLQSINLFNFNTANVTEMNSLFANCSNLTWINLSSFITSKVTSMHEFFAGCTSLLSIDISNFDTSEVTDIQSMFKDCWNLTSINLSNFDVKNVNEMDELFSGCIKLEELDISNFYISNVTSFNDMFKDCSSLKYLNLCMFQINENYIDEMNINNVFNDLPNETVYCINNNKTRNFLFSANKNFTCEDTCYNEYNNEYYFSTEIAENSFDSTIFSEEESTTYIEIFTTDKIFASTSNIQTTEFIEEKKETTNFFYSTKLYNTTNSISTSSKIDITYESGSFQYKNEKINNNNLIINNDEISNMEETSINDLIETDNKDDTKTFDISYFNNNTQLYNYLIENVLSIYNSNEGENKIFKGEENSVFQITTQKNELDLIKNRSNNIDNISIIDFRECEELLKNKYYINPNDSLIIIKKEILSTKASEKGVKYDVYEPYNKTKLNISYCDQANIKLYIPIVLSQETNKLYEQMKKSGYDIFNINDSFYNDICTPIDSENGTDILLCDRVDYIYYNDDTQCQSNCNMSMYSVESQYLECICSPNDDIIYENKKSEQFQPKKFYKVFYDVLKYSNYDIFKCYNLVLNINAVMKNIGSNFVIVCFIIYLVCLLYFASRKLIPLRNQLENELSKLNNKKYRNVKHNIINLFYPPIKKKSKVNKVKIIKKNEIKTKVRNAKSKVNFPSSKDSLKIYSGSRSKKNIIFNFNFNNSNKLKLDNNTRFKPKYPKVIKKEQYSDFELNELEYKEATEKDKRSLCEIYWANLKREHLIIFTFLNCNDYNLFAIKLSRLIFLFVGDMAFNVFFFSDDSMHKLFLSYGKYDFVQQIPQMTYSILISQIIEIFLCFLSLTDKYFYQLKSNLKSGKYDKNMKNVIKIIKIKLSFFFFFTFLFLILYWYIISTFCAVYRNTQLIFIKDSLYSFGIGLVYPLFFYFISAILRICALRDAKKNSECLYKFSDIIPLF